MKRIFFIIFVLAFQTAFSQDPPVTVLSQKWSEQQDLRIVHANDPFSAANAEIPTGANTSSPRQSVSGINSNKYFEYKTVIRNESKQNIFGLSWDYVFYDPAGAVEKSRKKFVLARRIKPQKKETLLGKTTNPPDLVLNAKDFEKGNPKYQEKVEITCVVFEDRTTWKPAGTDEKVCEELKKAIKDREGRLRKHGLKYE
jgi:hypothetical protein